MNEEEYIANVQCYDAKQAQYDYDGGVPADEDSADWFKSQITTHATKIG